MFLESQGYVFSSLYSPQQCLGYLKEYNTILPSRIELKGVHLRALSRPWGNKFRLSVYPWGLIAPMRWFYGEIIPQEKGCLIRGKFKVRWIFSIVALLFAVLLLGYGVSSQRPVGMSDLFIGFIFLLCFFGGVFFLLFKLNIFGRYSEEYVIEFLKKAFNAELKN